jgi:sialidase-1
MFPRLAATGAAVALTMSAAGGAIGVVPTDVSDEWPDHTDGVTVFDKDTEGFQCFRIPAVVRAPDGDLLAFAEARRPFEDKFCHDDGSIDLVLRRSSDEGKTWGPLETVLAGDPWGRDLGATRGNPVPIVLTEGPHQGRIVLLSTWNVEGSRAERRPFVQYSDDGGHTWSQATDLTEQLKPDFPTEGWYATGPQHGIQITSGPHAGRLVAGVNFLNSTESDLSQGGIAYSDDGGASWQLGATATSPVDADHFSEVGVEQAADGSLLAIGRSRKGEKSEETQQFSRAVAVSRDGGESFEEETFRFQSDLVTTPEVQGSILSVGADREETLVYAAPQHPTLRKDLGLFVSRDNGTSWEHAADVTRNRSGYSDMVLLENDHIGVLYETGLEFGDARDRIVFQDVDAGNG